MTREFSIDLDLVQFLPSVLVVIHHSNTNRLVLASVPFAGLGNCAVMVFYVRSDDVIAYVSANRENSLRRYAVSRLAGIYPVAIAAVLMPGVHEPGSRER